jgi:hypothetical protein
MKQILKYFHIFLVHKLAKFPFWETHRALVIIGLVTAPFDSPKKLTNVGGLDF